MRLPLKILVIRFSSIGDLILLTAVFHEIKKVSPKSEVHLLTKNKFKEIFSGNPHIDKIIGIESGEPAQTQVQSLSKAGYDYIFDAHSSLRSGILSLLLKIKNPSVKIFKVSKRNLQRYPLVWFKRNFTRRNKTQIETYLEILLKAFPAASFDKNTEIFPSETNFKEAKVLFSKADKSKKTLALNPCASYKTKQWSPEYFLRTAKSLAENYNVAVIGEKPDDPSRMILEALPDSIPLTGLPILTLAAALKSCDLVISNDSMVTHLAEAMNVKVLCLFGGTVPEFGFAPYRRNSRYLINRLPCQPCDTNGKNKCRNREKPFACFKELKPDIVIQTAEEMLTSPK